MLWVRVLQAAPPLDRKVNVWRVVKWLNLSVNPQWVSVLNSLGNLNPLARHNSLECRNLPRDRNLLWVLNRMGALGCLRNLLAPVKDLNRPALPVCPNLRRGLKVQADNNSPELLKSLADLNSPVDLSRQEGKTDLISLGCHKADRPLGKSLILFAAS